MPLPDREPQTGRTTAQLRSAPQHATYIAPTQEAIPYTLALATALGRTDLRIVGPAFIDQRQYLGSEVPIVADHATLAYPRPALREFVAWLDARAATQHVR